MKNKAAYWGSFDPPTLAHKIVILKALSLFKEVIIIVNNDSKKKYTAPIHHRINMIKLMLNNIDQSKYQILTKDDNNNYNSLKNVTNGKLYVIAGFDAFKQWLETHSFSQLKNYDGVYVIPRYKKYNHRILTANNIFILPIPNYYQNVSSNNIREQLKINAKQASSITGLDENVLGYIKAENLYS